MTRRLAVVALLLLPLAGLAQEKKDEKKKDKPAFVGIQIALGKKEGEFLIMMAIPKSPAEKAGLKTGDVLVDINGTKPATLQTAVKVIRALKPGKKVKFEIIRDGKRKEVELVPDILSE